MSSRDINLEIAVIKKVNEIYAEVTEFQNKFSCGDFCYIDVEGSKRPAIVSSFSITRPDTMIYNTIDKYNDLIRSSIKNSIAITQTLNYLDENYSKELRVTVFYYPKNRLNCEARKVLTSDIIPNSKAAEVLYTKKEKKNDKT